MFKAAGYTVPMASQLERLEAGLIHAHFEDGGIQALSLARLLDLPMVTTCHGCDVTVKPELRRTNVLKRRWHEKRRRLLLENGGKFVAVSNHIRERMIERGYPSSDIETHYIGVDTDLFAPAEGEKDAGMVLFVGRLVEKKGCAYLIKAMAALRPKLPESHLVIIGDGPLRSQLEALARSEGGRCEFLGVQPPTRVKELMGRASLVSVPSVTASNGDTEGLPLAVLEAQAMGLPVVGFHHAGIPEAVAHGTTGLLCPEARVDELTEYLACLLADRTLRESFGLGARRRMCESFNLLTQTAALEVFYQSALRPAGGVPRSSHPS
jgi:glycosyltransferase involved in cell wall biosynthesis